MLQGIYNASKILVFDLPLGKELNLAHVLDQICSFEFWPHLRSLLQGAYHFLNLKQFIRYFWSVKFVDKRWKINLEFTYENVTVFGLAWEACLDFRLDAFLDFILSLDLHQVIDYWKLTIVLRLQLRVDYSLIRLNHAVMGLVQRLFYWIAPLCPLVEFAFVLDWLVVRLIGFFVDDFISKWALIRVVPGRWHDAAWLYIGVFSWHYIIYY